MVMEDNDETMNSFAKRCNIDTSGMRLKLLGRQGVTRPNIRKVCEAFGVNREWLENGTGKMYDNDRPINIGGNTNIGSHVENSVQMVGGEIPMDKIADILKNAASKDMLIEVLQKQIEDLKSQNAKLVEIISKQQVGSPTAVSNM